MYQWPYTALICTDNKICTSRFSGIAATKMLQRSSKNHTGTDTGISQQRLRCFQLPVLKISDTASQISLRGTVIGGWDSARLSEQEPMAPHLFSFMLLLLFQCTRNFAVTCYVQAATMLYRCKMLWIETLSNSVDYMLTYVRKQNGRWQLATIRKLDCHKNWKWIIYNI